MNRNPLGIVLLLVGVVLLVFGFLAADSVASSFHRFFTGTPTDKSVWLIIGGVIALGAGAAMSAFPRER